MVPLGDNFQKQNQSEGIHGETPGGILEDDVVVSEVPVAAGVVTGAGVGTVTSAGADTGTLLTTEIAAVGSSNVAAETGEADDGWGDVSVVPAPTSEAELLGSTA